MLVEVFFLVNKQLHVSESVNTSDRIQLAMEALYGCEASNSIAGNHLLLTEQMVQAKWELEKEKWRSMMSVFRLVM